MDEWAGNVQKEMEHENVWSQLHAMKQLYGILHSSGGPNQQAEGPASLLDEKSKLFLKDLLDTAVCRAIQSHTKIMADYKPKQGPPEFESSPNLLVSRNLDVGPSRLSGKEVDTATGHCLASSPLIHGEVYESGEKVSSRQQKKLKVLDSHRPRTNASNSLHYNILSDKEEDTGSVVEKQFYNKSPGLIRAERRHQGTSRREHEDRPIGRMKRLEEVDCGEKKNIASGTLRSRILQAKKAQQVESTNLQVEARRRTLERNQNTSRLLLDKALDNDKISARAEGKMCSAGTVEAAGRLSESPLRWASLEPLLLPYGEGRRCKVEEPPDDTNSSTSRMDFRKKDGPIRIKKETRQPRREQAEAKDKSSDTKEKLKDDGNVIRTLVGMQGRQRSEPAAANGDEDTPTAVVTKYTNHHGDRKPALSVISDRERNKDPIPIPTYEAGKGTVAAETGLSYPAIGGRKAKASIGKATASRDSAAESVAKSRSGAAGENERYGKEVHRRDVNLASRSNAENDRSTLDTLTKSSLKRLNSTVSTKTSHGVHEVQKQRTSKELQKSKQASLQRYHHSKVDSGLLKKRRQLQPRKKSGTPSSRATRLVSSTTDSVHGYSYSSNSSSSTRGSRQVAANEKNKISRRKLTRQRSYVGPVLFLDRDHSLSLSKRPLKQSAGGHLTPSIAKRRDHPYPIELWRRPSSLRSHNARKPEEKREGRLTRLKNKLAVIFHHYHHHHHHHHHHAQRTRHKQVDDGHQSLWRRGLRRIFPDRRGRKVAERAAEAAPRKKEHGYLLILLERLARHLWSSRGRRGKKGMPDGRRLRKAGGLAGSSSKCGAKMPCFRWHKFRGRGGLKLAHRRRRPLLMLGRTTTYKSSHRRCR